MSHTDTHAVANTKSNRNTKPDADGLSNTELYTYCHADDNSDANAKRNANTTAIWLLGSELCRRRQLRRGR